MGRFFRRTGCFFLLVLALSVFSLTAAADEGSAELHALHFDIALQEDGSALITETREIVFSGDREFTRYGVNNIFAGPRVFSGWQASLDGMPLPHLPQPDNDNRPTNTFAVEDREGGNTVYIYFRQQGDGIRVVRISYRVENAVKLYDDVGEFFWNLTSETGISDIGTLTAVLTAPAGCPAEELNIWAHGPQNGSFDKQPDGSAALRVENVPLGTIVDIRSTLPASCFTGGWVQAGTALEGILAEEKALADSANARREEEARQQEEEARRRAESEAYWTAYWAERDAWADAHPVQNAVQDFCSEIYFAFQYDIMDLLPNILMMAGIGVFLIAVIWGKRQRNPKKYRLTPAQSPRYCQTMPDDRPAPVVDRLVHFYDGSPDVSRQISATLMELYQKKLVRFRSSDGDVELELNAQQDTAKQEMLPEYQEALWSFLLNAADGSGRMAMKELQQYIHDHQETAWKFRSSFDSAVSTEYKKLVRTETVKRPFFGGTGPLWILTVAAGILATLIRMFSTLYDGIEVDISICAGVITLTLAALMVFVFCLGRRFGRGRCVILNQTSENDLALWQAFGRYLDDFTNMEDRELPDFSAWQAYMVYAVAMGYGPRVAKALRLKYPEGASADAFTRDDDMYRMLQEQELYRAMESVSREAAEARPPVSDSSGSDFSGSDSGWSDSSGGGGGFSDSGGGSDSGSGGDFID
ncbi:MAG: DUF2207 family protein [Aristaeellaceae bacterium]